MVAWSKPPKMETRGIPVGKLIWGLKFDGLHLPGNVADEGRALRMAIDGSTVELW
jgi:hypothetical protein